MALRAALSAKEPAFEGAYYSFGGLVIDPRARQDRVPLWVGGRTLRSLRRAARLADGWCPFAVTPEEAAAWLSQVEVPGGFEVRLPPRRPLDPLAEPEAAADALGGLADAGVTIVLANFVHHSLEHHLEQLEALRAVNERL